MAASPPLPPDGARLLSDWGIRRGRATGAPRMHAGMDLGHTSGRGTPVLNVQAGTVFLVLRDDDRSRGFAGYGNGVIVEHADDTWALYAHMDRVDVTQGQRVAAGEPLGTMGATSNRKFPGMGVHLHIELRRRRPDGGAPFPGPYPQSVERPVYSLDPRPWLESKGLRFGARGVFEVDPGSAMALTRARWSGMAGLGAIQLDPKTQQYLREDNVYEPPARFDRDVRFGLRRTEWAMVGSITVGVAAVVVWSFLRETER